jgi:glycosyltransferase involved in cell wall biosynthesis
MKIAINTRLLIKNRLEGIGWFTCETMKRITRQHPEHEFIFIFDRPFSDEFIFADNITPVVLTPKARHPFLFYLWFEYRIPQLLKKHKVDLFVSPDGYLSLNTEVPQLAVIHDLSFLHRPQDLPWLKGWYYNYFFPRFAKKAVHIATVSNYSKQDIANSFKIDVSKIDVVHNGIKNNSLKLNDNAKATIRKKYSVGCPYFLYVGALHPRKNIQGLLQAFEIFKSGEKNNVKLLIAGGEMHKTGGIAETFRKMQFSDDVTFTGRVPEEELQQLFAAALALVYVPFFEGFGMPIIEAMHAGVPVICSDTTSMPEVGGDAVLYASPDNSLQIASAMEEIFVNPELRTDLINKGFIQKEKFSWDKTSTLLWKSIELIIQNFRQE